MMSAAALSCIAFACIIGGALFGMVLRGRLPERYLSTDTKDVVRLGTGVIATIAALVLGLLIASAKTSYDTQSTELRQMTANIVLLDRVLAQYGPETDPTRNWLRSGVDVLADRMWRENSSGAAVTRPFEASAASEAFFDKLKELTPKDGAQHSLLARATQISTDIAQTRLLLFAKADNAIPMPFLVVVIFWLTIIFGSFSLFARPNVIILGSLVIFALSAAGAIYLILELGQPFAGLMQISSAPLRAALGPLAH
jgi:hypothetical protein